MARHKYPKSLGPWFCAAFAKDARTRYYATGTLERAVNSAMAVIATHLSRFEEAIRNTVSVISQASSTSRHGYLENGVMTGRQRIDRRSRG
jgi:hypothetical protein